MRNHYWTIGPFADWLRGTKSPKAETSEGWRDWNNKAQAAHPIRYWLAEEGLRYLQNFFYYIPDRIYNAKYYINNRFVTRTHALTAHPNDIAPGDWCDVGNRFLPCLYNELRNFVEIELAWWHIAWSDRNEKNKYNAPFWATGWFRWRTWRCPQAGLDNLAWQMTLTNAEWCSEDDPKYGELTDQAIKAKEILELYTWWTVERPKRVDPMKASGWSDYCEKKWRGKISIFDSINDDDGEEIDTTPMHNMINELEAKYEKEDEEMMIRLIKIRQSLWT
ncbi:hypothetical protein UFOVP257_301 [uncultured Caudovirales phage]|uniref:Uncharacterized protein n=1 Tax=uncultured Caudovirales phage TaxID=2100421 RepID=A0A6J5LPB8_9CAUD|nr:hypothetical protein UFOVP257_301 [uncultured Caudovirales phage]